MVQAHGLTYKEKDLYTFYFPNPNKDSPITAGYLPIMCNVDDDSK